MAIFTENELSFLLATEVGRLATIGPTGAPQNHAIWFRVDADTGTVDIGGTTLTASQKYRNVRADPRVSLVVDDWLPEPAESTGERGRGVEIRGSVEIAHRDPPLFDGFESAVLRIHPRRVLAWNLDGPGYNARDVRR